MNCIVRKTLIMGLGFFAATIFSQIFVNEALADEEKEPRSMLGKIGSTVSDTVGAVGKSVGDTAKAIMDPKTAAEARREIDAEAKAGLEQLLKKSTAGRALYEKSYGYAVFDTRKFSFLITTGTGAGVAVEKNGGTRTYMKMLTGGANLGAGVQFYRVVFLFENKASLDKFVEKGWEANAEASASFGDDALAANARFVEGMAVFQLNETGIMANMNITGTRYWKSDDLNKGT